MSNISIYRFALDMTPGGVTPVVHLSQYDEAFQLEFTLYSRAGELDIPSGATAMIEGTKLDGKAYSANAAISGNVVTVTGDVQISAVAGNNPFQIVLKSGNSTIGSANFTISVERAALDYDTVSDSKLAQIQDISGTAAQLTAAAENVTDGVETFEALAESVSDMLSDIVDDTLSISGKAADAAKTGEELSNLKSELEAFTDCEIILSKTFTTNTKNTNDWITTGLPVLDPVADYYAYLIAVENVNVSTHPYLYINNTYTSGNNTQTPINNIGKFTKIVFDNTREYNSTILNLWKSETTLSEPVRASWVLIIVKGTPQSVYFEDSISRIDDEINAVENAVESNGGYLLDWSNSIYYYGSGVIGYANNRIGITVAVIAKSNIQVSIAQGYKYAVFRFSSTTLSTETEISNTGWLTSDHIISKDDIFLINIAKVDDSAITGNDGQKITMISFMSRGDVSSDYVIMADMLKCPVSTNQVGSVKYAQSFCVYNGKYYSTDGSNISEQDASFNVLRDVRISLGHGNALQLGSGKYAYASGWDDNKIYVVDLDNLEVVNIITLPTTGYTTCVVDDLNKLAFVFQRDSVPDTVENYNFIIYDYDNQEIKSQRVINAFGAMQAADYYNGKIIITWGTGTVALPSGMAIYNTSGDILAEYNLSIFSTSEPEGVCFSRESEKLLIGIWNTLYEIRRKL